MNLVTTLFIYLNTVLTYKKIVFVHCWMFIVPILALYNQAIICSHAITWFTAHMLLWPHCAFTLSGQAHTHTDTVVCQLVSSVVGSGLGCARGQGQQSSWFGVPSPSVHCVRRVVSRLSVSRSRGPRSWKSTPHQRTKAPRQERVLHTHTQAHFGAKQRATHTYTCIGYVCMYVCTCMHNTGAQTPRRRLSTVCLQCSAPRCCFCCLCLCRCLCWCCWCCLVLLGCKTSKNNNWFSLATATATVALGPAKCLTRSHSSTHTYRCTHTLAARCCWWAIRTHTHTHSQTHRHRQKAAL